MKKKKIIVAVINDLVTDQRVSRECNTLTDMGFDVLLVGRQLPGSLPMPETRYRHHRMKLLFHKGAAFYAEYNLRLFFFLLFRPADIIHCNDLDTLLAGYTAAKLKGASVVYDSHEYFTEVPELQHNRFARSVWQCIEKLIVPKLRYCITVNQSIATIYREKYGVPFAVLRNMPVRQDMVKGKTREELGMPAGKRIVLLQGSGINMHRGAEELVESFRYLDDSFCLYIIGGGDVIEQLKKMSENLGLGNKVYFLHKQPYALLMNYTANADIGVTLDKDTNLNYRYSLPNKIFDYIQAGIPVLSSGLVELERVINEWQVGWTVPEVSPEAVAAKIREIFAATGELNAKKQNTFAAAAVLNWNEEKKVLEGIYMNFKPQAIP